MSARGGFAWAPELILAAALVIVSCERETREFNARISAAGTLAKAAPIDTLHAAGDSLVEFMPASLPTPGMAETAAGRAWDLSEGKRLFSQWNCSGCHANGGGSMGPPLMDRTWIYGSSPESLYSTIVRGRPNGMPSFSGRIPQRQLWQLVAYVRSMSGHASFTGSPGRNDDMEAVMRPENSRRGRAPVDRNHQPEGSR
jgi:cytochrome c oxidase cbb3-type subunit 3